MKKNDINALIGREFVSEIRFSTRSGPGRAAFDAAIFENGSILQKLDFGKFCRLLKQNHVNEALAFVLDKEQFRILNSQRRKNSSAIGGRATMANAQNHVQNRHFEHWSRGTKGLVKAWNKGLSKETDDRCKNISLSKVGYKNPMFGRQVSSETREKLSAKTRENIASGKWTPNTFNSRTRKQLLFRGVFFRSSWEALFFQSFPTAQYEKIRIPYITDRQHVLITDFVIDKTIYEIKPRKQIEQQQNKISVMRKWCTENGYDFVVLDEFALTSLIPFDSVMFKEFDERTEKLLRGLYASVEKRKNREAINSL